MYKYSELLVSVFLNWRPFIEGGRTSVAYSGAYENGCVVDGMCGMAAD